MADMYNTNLDKNDANFVPLTPLSFLKRSAEVYPHKTSIVHGERIYNWEQTYKRSLQFASALSKHGIGKNDTVSILSFNTPEIYEAHYAVPKIGAVLNTLAGYYHMHACKHAFTKQFRLDARSRGWT